MKKTTIVFAILFPCFIAKSQDTFTDKRDRAVYQIVTIDGTEWFTENLRFEPKEGSDSWRGDTSRKTEYSYMPILEADKAFDKTHGRYYYDAALKVCPTGWTLPEESDFAALSIKFGGDSKSGHSLKSKTDWFWATTGDNRSGFNAMPYGFLYTGSNFGKGESAYFWVKGKVKDGEAPFRSFTSRDGDLPSAFEFKLSSFPVAKIKMSIRCIKK
jgi:uncharacterized protein (TIGR02145 family)